MFRTWLRTLLSYLRTPPTVQAVKAREDLRDEIAFHLASSVSDHVDSGLDERHSRHAALDEFGDIRSVFRECGEVSVSRHLLFHRVHVVVTAGLLIAVALLVWRSKPDRRPDLMTHVRFAQAPTGYPVSETDGDIRGDVTGEDGEPVSAAHVLAVVKTWPPNGFRQQAYMATTRSDGSFFFEDVYPTKHDYEVQIAALADGRLLCSRYIPMTTGTLESLDFRLERTTPFALRFESGDGIPIAGVSVFPAERIEHDGDRHSVYFCSADPIVRESGATGSVSMPHFRPGEQATVFVRFPDSDWQQRQLVIPREASVIVVTPIADAAADDG